MRVSFFLVSSLTILLTCCFSVKTSLFYSILFLRISFYPPYKALREAIAKTVVEILGEKSNIMYILETEDRKTGLKDGSATAGHNFFVRGAMLKVVGDHESVGVTLTDSKGATTKLTDDQITINNPSSLTLLLPADLAEGEYTLTVTTQYGSAGHILKTPRSVSTQIWVGGKPADGGGDSESPDEI